MNTKQTVLQILSDIKPGVDFENSQDLITSRQLDSLTLLTCVGELTDEFDIAFTPADIVPQNFCTVDAIVALIHQKEEA